MLDLHYPTDARIRVWWGEYPDVPLLARPQARVTFASTGAVLREQRRIAIEWLRPVGGYALYGLLGAEMLPSAKGFKAIVWTGVDEERGFGDSLARSTFEVALCGLPAEYTDAVQSGILAAMSEAVSLPGAAVDVNLAVHGVVGSCDQIFFSLARAASRFLLNGGTPNAELVRQWLVDE